MSIADHMAGHAQPIERGHAPQHGMPPAMEHDGKDGGDGGVHEHLAALHASMGGQHFHAHHDGMGGYTSHQVHEDGHHEGPHQHESHHAMAEHMKKFMGGEGEEASGAGAEEPSGEHESLFG